MFYRRLGKTELKVSALGFGCGAGGGLLVKGDPREMVRTVARAVELGINYFDTAVLYGNGQSETNLGAVLAELGVDVIVGTKVRLVGADIDDIEAAIIRSVEGSLRRLRRESIELIQLHNLITLQRQPQRQGVTLADVEVAMQTFETLAEQGKVQHWGINGLGDTPAIHQALATNTHTVQCCYNLLNPSAGRAVSADFPFQNYGQLIDKAAENGMGVIAIRILAGGALSGSTQRHPNAMSVVDPIASHDDYAQDVAWAQRFDFLVKEGHANNLVEAAIRFALSKPEISTALVGISNLEQLEVAVQAANKGPFSATVIGQIEAIGLT
ncbi:MAG: aldo/keto reductase [Caldilineaceae bacterium]